MSRNVIEHRITGTDTDGSNLRKTTDITVQDLHKLLMNPDLDDNRSTLVAERVVAVMAPLESQSAPKFDGDEEDYVEFVMNAQLYNASHKKDEWCWAREL